MRNQRWSDDRRERRHAADAVQSDLRDEPWYGFLEYLDDLLGDPRLHWAEAPLRHMHDVVEQTHMVPDDYLWAATTIERSPQVIREWGKVFPFLRKHP